MKTADISILLAEYKKAKETLNASEIAFDDADPDTVDDTYTAFEEAQESLARIACRIVDALIEST